MSYQIDDTDFPVVDCIVSGGLPFVFLPNIGSGSDQSNKFLKAHILPAIDQFATRARSTLVKVA